MKSISKNFIDLVNVKLNNLPLNYLMPIFLRIQENLSISEISEILDLPEKLIQAQIEYGLNTIKISLLNDGKIVSVELICKTLCLIEKIRAPDNLGNISNLRALGEKQELSGGNSIALKTEDLKQFLSQ